MKKIFALLCGAALVAGALSCSRGDKWEIKGDVKGADGKTLVLETSFNGNWYPLDSTKIKSNGSFSFKQPAAQYPAIYRLSLEDKKAYFPVDSIESLTFSGNMENFDRNYTVSGSPNAEMLTHVNGILAEAGANAVTDNDIKRKLSELVLTDPSGITAYYIINSTTPNGKPVFNPNNPKDLRVIGAVANAYSDRRPTDPRTAYLTNFYLSNRKATMKTDDANKNTIIANEISYPEIELLDENGVAQTLSDFTGNGPVVVSFTIYGSEYSPALNMELGNLYEAYAPRGLEIYQVAFDTDEFQWRQSARNLPWITVFNSPKEGASTLLNYNVGRLPATFIIDKDGILVERILDPDQIAVAVKKYM